MNEKLQIIISAQVQNLRKNVEDAQKKVLSFKQQVEKASKDVDGKFESMGSAAANAGKVMAGAFVAVGTALLALGASTAEYRQEQAKLETAFEAAGGSAETAKATYNDLYRVLGDSGQATEAAAHLAQLTTNQQELSEWTTICQGVYATFGDSIPIEGLTEAANETAKVGTVTGSLADALNWAGISEDAFNESLAACNSEAEREALIRETLTGIYDEAAATYEENNAQLLAQNEAQASLQDTLAALGEAVQPVITAFTEFAADALEPIVPVIQSLAEEYGPQLSDALSTMADLTSTVVSALVDNWDTIVGLAAVIGGIAAAIGIYNAVAAIKAAMAAAEVTTVWALVAAYAAQAAAVIVAIAPYLLIVAAIAAVIAIIVICVKHWDEIKEAIANAWETIKEKTQAAVDAVVQWFNNLKTKIQEKIQAIKDKVSEIFENIKTAMSEKIQAAKNLVTSIFEGIKNSIQNKIELAKSIVSNVVGAIKGIFTGDFGAVKTSISNIFESIKSSIKTKLENAKTTVSNIINAIKGFFSFQISWPHIPMPHFSVSPAGWRIGDLLSGSIPRLSISWYAKGGVFDEPTVFSYGNGMLGGLGENGAEAVVPLENNLGWLDKLATMLNERMGGGTPIVLTVDGKVFAQTAISTINQQTKQTGKLALNLM